MTTVNATVKAKPTITAKAGQKTPSRNVFNALPIYVEFDFLLLRPNLTQSSCQRYVIYGTYSASASSSTSSLK